MTTFVPVGGFLGAGKTTLILAASRVLAAAGKRAAVILNDQGSALVDTTYVEQNGVTADQVTGGCFCCRFSDFIDAAQRLRAFSPDVIFAEAVGSCTDISATTLQPLKRDYADQFRLAPYSVLVDPARAKELAKPKVNADLAFLFQKQIEEADLVCFTKADLYSEFPSLGAAPTRYLSGLTGDGVAAWLDEILLGQMQAGQKILEIDYERYARAEAKLAWLNLKATIELDTALSPAMVIGPLIDELDAALTAHGFEIAHLKVLDDSPSGSLKASLVRNSDEQVVDGMRDASPALVHNLLLNIRAAGEPAALRRLVETQLARLPGEIDIESMQCFSPAPPKPEQRLSFVVGS